MSETQSDPLSDAPPREIRFDGLELLVLAQADEIARGFERQAVALEERARALRSAGAEKLEASKTLVLTRRGFAVDQVASAIVEGEALVGVRLKEVARG